MGKNNLDSLERIDSKYLNCFKTQMYHYFRHIGLPIDLLLYNTYESTEDISLNVIQNRRVAWTYPTKVFNGQDLSLLGIEIKECNCENFYEGIALIKNEIDNGGVVSISCDTFYLPHRTRDYHQNNNYHHILVTGYFDSGQIQKMYIIDDMSPSFVHQVYDLDIIKSAFENVGGSFYLFSHNSEFGSDELREIITMRYHLFIKNFRDDLGFYNVVNEIIKEKKIIEDESLIFYLEQSFHLLSGSRYIFSHFLENFDRHKYKNTILKLLECCDLLDKMKLKIFLIRDRIMRNGGNIDISVMCDNVRRIECDIQNDLVRFS